MVFYTGINYGAEDRLFRIHSRDVFARNAFNGILAWKRPIDGVPGGGDTPPRFALTAKANRVYCYPDEGGKLHALDAGTGQTIFQLEDGPDGPPLKGWDKWKDPVAKILFFVRVLDGKVIQARHGHVYASDASSGKLLWRRSLGGQAVIGWVVAGDTRVYAVVADQPLFKNRASPVIPASRVVALDLKSGKTLWTYDGLSDYAVFRMILYRESIILPAFSMKGAKPNFGKNPVVVRLSAEDGREVWRSMPKGSTRGHYPIVMARGDEIFVGQQGGFGVEFGTGKLTQGYNWGQNANSCADLKCVPDYTMYGGTFIDTTGRRSERGQTRTICDVGLFPAYGLLYGSPLGCLCSEYLNGYTALSPVSPDEPLDDFLRLEKGPAFGSVEMKVPLRLADGWPMHLANPRRSACVDGGGPLEPKQLWERKLASWPKGTVALDWRDNEKIVGLLSAPVVANGRVFVAAPDTHKLYSIDALTGEQEWVFTAGARIDSPPTVLAVGDDSLCVVGCRDGYIYALRTSDGAMVWRFLAARNHRRIVVEGQLESSWPLIGSVMVDGDGLVVGAGRQSAIDGGVYFYKLSPANGEVIWRTRLWRDPELAPDDKDALRPYIRNQRVNDLLVYNGSQPCLWITPLNNSYTEDETVDIDHSVISARAMKHSVVSKEELREQTDATWLWSASSAGLLSRRSTGVGRHDEGGVNYADINAKKICFSENTLYALEGGAAGAKEIRGGLIAVRLKPDGKRDDAYIWKGKAPPQGARDAMVVARNRIYVANGRSDGTAALYIYSTGDGELLGKVPLPSRVVRDGLAVAAGNLYASCSNGTLLCLRK